MRVSPAAALAATVLLAGCFGASTHSTTATPPPVASHGWTLDCGLGAFERAKAPWAQDCEARASHTAGAKQETWIAINPTDVRNVVVAAKDLNPDSSKNCVWNGVFVTHDAGATWTDVVIGGKWADRQLGSPYYGYACNTDPDFRFSRDGSLHYGVEMYNLANNGACVNPGGNTLTCVTPGFKILLATSHDGGLTWPDVITYQPDFGVTTDFSRMTVTPTTQSIVEAIGSEGTVIAGPGCHILISRDGGKTAQPPVDVVTKDGVPCGSSADTAIAASPKGTLVLVGGAFTTAPNGGLVGGSAQPIVVRSTDDGTTWTDSNPGFTFNRIPGTFQESQYRISDTVELAYDLGNGTRAGTLYATYAASDRQGDEADIYVRSSKDDGRTWSDEVLVNNDTAGAHQWMPNVAVAADGSVHVFYMDKRYDSAHKLIGITHAWSLDGGKTWANERVSTVSFDGDLGKHQEGFPFIGDYLGVDCVGRDCWAGFPDSSNGKITVIAAAHTHLA
jgi:hypothetical protein